jgi:beta-phosphoglucomutase-like phosphatase (HAD superfamily)
MASAPVHTSSSMPIRVPIGKLGGVSLELECDALLFDLDGVLVDSSGVVERILREWAALRGVDADRTAELSHGRRDADLIPLIAPHLDVETEVGWIVRRSASHPRGASWSRTRCPGYGPPPRQVCAASVSAPR